MTTKRMTTQPTPGPWFVSTDGVRVLCGDPNNPEIVVDCEGDDIMAVRLDDAPGNARLIAAAPRMLEALKSLRSLSAFKAEANGAGPVYCWCDHEQPDDPNADHAPLCITFRALLREIHGDPS